MSRVPEVITGEASSHAIQTYGTTKASQKNSLAFFEVEILEFD
jgi:hypothetical protein